MQSDHHNSLITNEDPFEVGAKRDIATPIETSSAEVMSEIVSTDASSVPLISSGSTFFLSSGPLDKAPSAMISAEVNENNNFDILGI